MRPEFVGLYPTTDTPTQYVDKLYLHANVAPVTVQDRCNTSVTWRRNPNGPPDNSFAGYNFWVGKLIKFNGDFLKAEMVKAFLSSAEYRSRFGP